MNPPAGPVRPWMLAVPPPRIIVLSSDAFTEARCEKMSAADPTPIVKSSTTISHRLASFNRPSMFPSSAQPLGAGRASGHGLPPHFCCVVVLPFYSSERLHNPPPRRVRNVRTVAKTVNLITRSLPSAEQTLQFACLYLEPRADSVGLHLGTEVVGFG